MSMAVPNSTFIWGRLSLTSDRLRSFRIARLTNFTTEHRGRQLHDTPGLEELTC